MLQKQNIPVAFSGLDTKGDEKTLTMGKLTRLENAVVNNSPSIDKRPGYSALPAITASALFTLNDELLALNTSTRTLQSYSPAQDAWFSRGTAYCASTETAVLQAGLSSQICQEYVEVNGRVGVCAYLNTSNEVILFIKDLESGALILPPTNTTYASAPGALRLVASSDSWWLIFRDNINLVCLHGLAGSSLYTAVTHQTDADPATPIDATTIGSSAVVVYQSSTVAKIFYITPNNVLGSPVTGLADVTDLTVNWSSGGLVCVSAGTTVYGGPAINIFAVNSTTLDVQTLTTSFADYNGVTVTSETLPYTPVRIAATNYLSDLSTTYFEFDTLAGGTLKEESVVYQVPWVVNTGFGQTPYVLARGSILAQPSVIGDNEEILSHLLYTSEEGLQNSVFHFLDTSMVGRSLPGTAAGRQAHVHRSVSGVFACANIIRAGNSGSVKISINTEYAPNTIDVLDTVYLSGSFLQQYDGGTLVESGFLLYPEPLSLTQNASGGSISNGTYLVTGIFEWADAQGNLMRSAPATPVSITVNGGGTSQRINAEMQTLWNTLKTSVTSPVVLSVYRTLAGGTVYYKAATSAPTDFSQLTTTIVLSDSDATISSNELLYTTGGVLENIPPPSNTVLSKYGDRVAVTGGECGTKIYWSKPRVSAETTDFSDILFTDLATEQRPSAIAEMDEKCVVFTESRTIVLTGSPGDATGNNSSLSRPQTLPADVGSVTPFVASTPQGLMFQSKKGIWLLDRGLSPSYIGAPVERLISSGDLITSALNVPQDNKVLFTSSDSGSFVYDTFFALWSRYTPSALAGVILQGEHCILRPDGSVWQTGTTYGDDSSPFQTLIETGWLSFTGIMGFQRLYNLCFLGKRQGSGAKLVVDVCYDFNDTVVDSYTFDVDSLVNGVYGTGDYGEEEAYGGNTTADGVFRLRLKPRRQKCSSIKLIIRDVYPEGDQSQGFQITALQAEVGVVGGRGKQGTSKNLTRL